MLLWRRACNIKEQVGRKLEFGASEEAMPLL
jgi:hypothetical protein